MKNKAVTAHLTSRLKQLRHPLEKNEAFLISTPNDIAYFSGFDYLVPEEREAFLIVTPKSALLHHASFSPYEKPGGIKTLPHASIEQVCETLEKLKKDGLKRLLVDKSDLKVAELEAIQYLTTLKTSGLNRDHIWQIRAQKDELELKAIRQAAKTTRLVMSWIKKQLRPGLTEQEVRDLIEAELKKRGSEKPAFPTIVAFGPHAALPHHQPTSVKLKAETPILLDFGATIGGYRGDMTRTFWFGQRPSEKFKEVEKIIKKAYRAAIKVFTDKKEFLAKDLDEAARAVITTAGYGGNFIHTTGHGLGLDIHESISLNSQNQQPILPGMVITVEPGIYLEDNFGYRHENMVLVTKNGVQELTT